MFDLHFLFLGIVSNDVVNYENKSKSQENHSREVVWKRIFERSDEGN